MSGAHAWHCQNPTLSRWSDLCRREQASWSVEGHGQKSGAQPSPSPVPAHLDIRPAAFGLLSLQRGLRGLGPAGKCRVVAIQGPEGHVSQLPGCLDIPDRGSWWLVGGWHGVGTEEGSHLEPSLNFNLGVGDGL